MVRLNRANRGAAAAALWLLLAPSGVRAAGPQTNTEKFTVSGPFLMTDMTTEVTCGGDTVWSDAAYTCTTTTWSENGQIRRQKLHCRTDETWYLHSNPGRTLRGATNYEAETLIPGVSLYSGLEMWTGVFWHVFGPGNGTVFLDAGLEIIDWRLSPKPVVKAAGRHDWIDGKFDGLCAALQ